MAGFTHCYPLSNQAYWVVGHHAQRWVLRVQQQARVRFMVLTLQAGGGLTQDLGVRLKLKEVYLCGMGGQWDATGGR